MTIKIPSFQESLLFVLMFSVVCVYYAFLGPLPLWLLVSLSIAFCYVIVQKSLLLDGSYSLIFKIGLPWLLYSVYTLIRDMVSMHSFDFSYMLNLFTLILFVMAVGISARVELKSFTLIFAIMIAIQASFAIAQVLGIEQAWSVADKLNALGKGQESKYAIEGRDVFFGRVRGLSTFIHIFAPLISSSAAFLFLTLRKQPIVFSKKIRLFLVFITIMAVLSSILTFSRSAILGLLAVFILEFISFKTIFSPRRLAVLIGFVVLIFFLGQYFVVNFELDQIDRILKFGQSDSSSDSKRFGSYAFALNLISQNPLFGVGIANSSQYIIAIHSVPLKIVTSYGLLGIILYAWTILSIIAVFLSGFFQKSNKVLKKFSIVCLGFLFISLFDSAFHTSGILAKNIFEMGVIGFLIGQVIAIQRKPEELDSDLLKGT